MIAYKIVESSPKGPKTLFHGLNGSRLIPKGKWLKAEKKMVKDGTSKTQYLSGWHVLPSEEEAAKYLQRFKTRIDKLCIIPVLVKNIRQKSHSNSNVWLADSIKIFQ
jgi:hypothetical protein